VLHAIAGALRSSFAGGADIKAEMIFRTAIDACPFGVVLVEPPGKIVLANGETERIFGYARDELIGQSVDILISEKLRAQYGQYHSRLTVHPEIRKAESRRLVGLRKDGSEIHIEVVLRSMQTNERVLMLGVFVDITERMYIERLKDDLAATVSHELRTPLASISAALGLLINAADKTVPKPMMRLLTIAHNNSQRLVRLVNSILDAEKIESCKVAFALKRVELRSLVEQTMEAARGFADNDGVRIGPEAVAVASDTRALVGRTIADVERDLILETLKRRFGNRTHAASILGISIRTLRNKLNEYAADGMPIPLPGGSDIYMVHQAQSAQARNSSRDARILQRGERRHAVL
jgi:PAS domain S-box-containing protein